MKIATAITVTPIVTTIVVAIPVDIDSEALVLVIKATIITIQILI